ncbi:Single-stranded nucleic acid binding R3H protein [Rhynchospora pubera]|uniref:Single-stranded nucleic acid binding R3H protein n=1 Tax=Rhynchospora pubera TaxID=906938 RepID=A0AAV8HTV3_9POAL|nr:Single-stranded nucleic acid binding R3H protein [Rhynchospora pubera]
MDLPESDFEESMPVAEAALEDEEPLPLIDLRLIDAVLNPQFCRTVLSMEEKIQKFMLNPDVHEIELPNFDSSYLREITGILARYYGLKLLSTEGTRVFARQTTPNRRMPSLTLSAIPPAEPEEDLTAGSKFIGIFTILKRQNCGASSGNLPEPKTRRSMEERDGEYYKARARIFNESVSSSSIPPVVSRSISSVQSKIVRDCGQDGTGGTRRIRIPVHNSGGANQNSSQTVNQDVTTPSLRIRIPVHNPGANQNSNQTSPRPGRRITHLPPIIDDASNFLHQPMQYPSMQYGEPALPPYGESLYPYELDPYGGYPVYQYHPYLASDPLYNPAYADYMPWSMVPSMQSVNHGMYNPAYSGYMPWSMVPSTQ